MFQKTGAIAGTKNSSNELRTAFTIPERPSMSSVGKRIWARRTARSSSAPERSLVSSRIERARKMPAIVSPVSATVATVSTVDAIRHARRDSPRSRSSLKTGTSEAPSAASATSERTVFGTLFATV